LPQPDIHGTLCHSLKNAKPATVTKEEATKQQSSHHTTPNNTPQTKHLPFTPHNPLQQQHCTTRLLTATQAQHQVECGFLLDVVVGQGAAILQLLASEDQTLLVRGDACAEKQGSEKIVSTPSMTPIRSHTHYHISNRQPPMRKAPKTTGQNQKQDKA
jgi:hypothetical protein